MAPSWFLLPMFCISFIFFFLKKMIKRNDLLLLVTFCAFIIVIHYRKVLSNLVWNNCAIIINLVVGLFIHTCGYMCNQNKQIINIRESKYTFDFLIIACLILCEAKNYWNYSLDLRAGFISSSKWMFITYISGMCFLICISIMIGKYDSWLKEMLSYIGKRSMSIMFFHVSCFSIVTLIGIYILGDSYEPSWTNAFYGNWYGYANVCAGISVPLMIGYWMEKLMKCTKRLECTKTGRE